MHQKEMEKNMSYPIIKNAGPVPPLVRRNGAKDSFVPKYPFYILEVGDAFDIEGTGEISESGHYPNWKSAAAYASVYGRKHGKKFTARRVSENVYRFWRTA
jgi:hypothetical protein